MAAQADLTKLREAAKAGSEHTTCNGNFDWHLKKADLQSKVNEVTVDHRDALAEIAALKNEVFTEKNRVLEGRAEAAEWKEKHSAAGEPHGCGDALRGDAQGAADSGECCNHSNSGGDPRSTAAAPKDVLHEIWAFNTMLVQLTMIGTDTEFYETHGTIRRLERRVDAVIGALPQGNCA